MAEFLTYSLATGVIAAYGSCDDGLEAMQAGPGYASLLNAVGATPDTYYVLLGDPNVLTARAAMGLAVDHIYIAAGSTQSATITNIPPGTELFVGGDSQGTVSDGDVVFAADAVATYALTFQHYRYLLTTIRIGVGIAEFAPAGEVEHAVGLAAMLPAVVEVEAALDAVVERIMLLAAAAEVEAAVAATMSRLAELDPASETELPPNVTGFLYPAVEVEAALDAGPVQIVLATPAVEVEEALDVAA